MFDSSHKIYNFFNFFIIAHYVFISVTIVHYCLLGLKKTLLPSPVQYLNSMNEMNNEMTITSYIYLIV